MLRDLFINACILIASMSMGSQIFKETGLSIASTNKARILEGLSGGLLGCVLIFFSIYYKAGLVVDFRSLAIILTAVYGGVVSSTIAAVMVVAFRMLWFGFSTSSLIASINILAIGVTSGIICHYDLARWKKWALLIANSLVINIVTFYIILKDKEVFFQVAPLFVVGTVLIAIFLYNYTRYLESFNIYNQKLKEEATVDFLTGLNNVRQFDNILHIVKKDIKEGNQVFSLLYIDIDFFKKVNDTYGHVEGDTILEQLSKILKQNCRSFDFVFRIGGEEFSVLLLNCHSTEAIEIAERIRSSVENHNFILTNGKTIKITVSIGAGTFSSQGVDLVNIKEVTDSALYQAKSRGRNMVCVAENNLENGSNENLHM